MCKTQSFKTSASVQKGLGVERIAEWIRSNQLRLNPEKTGFLWCATRRRCIHLDTAELSVCGTLIRPSTSVRHLGVLLETNRSCLLVFLSLPVHEAPCCVDGRLLLSSAPSHQELHQVVASWGCEGGCRRFCHVEGRPLQQPARRRACVPPGRTPVGPQCRSEAHLQQEEVWPCHAAPPRCSPLAASPIPHRVQALSNRLPIPSRSCSRVPARLLHRDSFLRVLATATST